MQQIKVTHCTFGSGWWARLRWRVKSIVWWWQGKPQGKSPGTIPCASAVEPQGPRTLGPGDGLVCTPEKGPHLRLVNACRFRSMTFDITNPRSRS